MDLNRPRILRMPEPAMTPPGGGTPPAAPQAPDFDKLIAGAFERSLPSIVEAVSAKVVAQIKPATPPAPEPKTGEGDDKGQGKKIDRVAELEASLQNLASEVQKRDAALAAERQLNAIRGAAQKVNWFDVEDAVRELSGQVNQKDGQYVVSVTETVAGTNIKKDISIDEAVTRLSKAKPHWVKADLKSGTGAAGNAGASARGGAHPFSALTYQQIIEASKKNPTAFREYFADHRDEFEAKKSAALVTA